MNRHSEIQGTLPSLLSDLWCVIRSRVRALLPGGIPTLAWGLSLMWRWPCRIMSTCYQAGHSHAMRTANRRGKKSAASNLVPMLGRGHEFAHSAGVMSRRPVLVCGLQRFTSALKLLLVEIIFKKKEMRSKMRLFLRLSGDRVARLLSVTCEQRQRLKDAYEYYNYHCINWCFRLLSANTSASAHPPPVQTCEKSKNEATCERLSLAPSPFFHDNENKSSLHSFLFSLRLGMCERKPPSVLLQ